MDAGIESTAESTGAVRRPVAGAQPVRPLLHLPIVGWKIASLRVTSAHRCR